MIFQPNFPTREWFILSLVCSTVCSIFHPNGKNESSPRQIGHNVYLKYPINIQMSKLSSTYFPNIHNRPSSQSYGSHKSVYSIRKPRTFNMTSKLVTESTKVGGLGLASSLQSHVSLGSLVSSSQQKVSVANRDDSISLGKPNHGETNQWSLSPIAEPSETVSMRVMGQTIRAPTFDRLHPNVSPSKTRKLRRILGSSLDREWTSETPPRAIKQRGITSSLEKLEAMKLVREANILNLTFENDLNIPKQYVEAFKTWLIDKATCEVNYVWEDLGPLYWPRYIRSGVCVNRLGHSCSWPPGMKCKFSGSRALELLHWKCEDAAQTQSRNRAAEQRNLRRAATTNMFQSRFYDMKPVVPPESNTKSTKTSFSRLSLRDTHETIGMRSPNNQVFSNRFQPSWTQVTQSPISIEERKRLRAKRLIKRLSVTSNGYYCHWQIQKHLIGDRCACLCS